MQNLQNKLCEKYKWYRELHSDKRSNLLFWSLFIFIAILSTSSILRINENQMASAYLTTENAPLVLFSTPATSTKLSTFTKSVMDKHKQDKTTVRNKLTRLNLSKENHTSLLNVNSISIELFDGKVVLIDKSKIEKRGTNNFTWYGKIKDLPASEVILTFVDGYLTGNVTINDKNSKSSNSYAIESAGDDLYIVREFDYTNMPDEPWDSMLNMLDKPEITKQQMEEASDAISNSNLTNQTTAADTGASIDLMVVYTNQTALAAGTSINSQIQNAVDRTNLSFANTGLTGRIRLVHTENIPYQEGGGYLVMLNDLAAGTNGAGGVAALRNTYRADLVSMFAEDGSYCGIGFLNSNESSAFTVVNRGCSAGNLSLAHEIGHNFGAHHDPATSQNSYYAYGHGYVDPLCQFRTVMAYQTCVSPRVAYFSSPDNIYPGTSSVMGNQTVSDNKRVISERANTLANFRLETGTNCVHNNPTISITPTSQTGSSGQSLVYQVKVLNNDSGSCDSSVFGIVPTLPSQLSQVPNTLSFVLAPGAQTTQSIVLTSTINSSPSTYTFVETVRNESTPSFTSSANASYVITVPDLIAPIVNINKPAPNTSLPKKGSGKLNIQVGATDESGIYNINILVDNISVKSCSMTTSCSYSWSYSQAPNGPHTITATATDNSTNRNQSSKSITVTK